MKNVKALGRDDAVKLLLLASILLGGWFRFFPAFLAGFPVNDGGMFFVMMKDLQANHFLPPLFTSYNHLDIPFAYPPLTLYLGAALNSLLGLSLLDVLRWLPALVNTICIPALYLLAKELLEDDLQAALSALVFALTPHLMDWLSMGGGLTRSFGTLFMLLTALFAYRLFARGEKNNIGWTILFGGLTVLSHTESTVFAIALPILFWLFKSRSRTGLVHGMWVALGVIALAGPWYGLVVSRYGIETLLSALRTGGHTPLVVLLLFDIRTLTAEPFLDLLGALGVLGVVTLTVRRRYLVPALLVTIYLVETRSAHTVGNIALAMGAGTFLAEVLLPALQNRVALLLALMAPFLLGNAIYHGYVISLDHVSAADRSAMEWVMQNTPTESRFLVLTGEPTAMCDSVGEWFPALTDRHSLITIQGREWTMGADLEEVLRRRIAVEACLDGDLDCLEQEISYFGAPDYIYISANIPTNSCKDLKNPLPTRSLFLSLTSSPDYQVEYQSGGVSIFSKK